MTSNPNETATSTIEARAIDSPLPWAQGHIRQYLESDGARVDHPMADALILLYVKGKKSGQIRRVPVAHYADGESLIVIGSKGGAPDHPSWYLNLRHDPQVWVRRRSEFFEARAEDLEGEEYERMWETITAWVPGFGEYRTKTSRRIPLVRLRPV